MSPCQEGFAKILFCDVDLICNLATEFNGLVSKQDWLFLRPVLFILVGTLKLLKLPIYLIINVINIQIQPGKA
jgi:hypothetical protein